MTVSHNAEYPRITTLPRLRETLGDAIDAAAAEFGEAEGWVFGDRRMTFIAMKAEAERIALALLGLGVGKGDVVATWTPNAWEFSALMFACAEMGAIVAPLNTRFRSEEARFILEHSEAVALVYSPSFLSIDFRHLVREAASGLEPAADSRVLATALPRLRHIVELGDDVCAPALSWDDFIAKGKDYAKGQLSEIRRAQQPSDPMLLQYTSGTTAFPKGALLNHTFVLNYGPIAYLRLGVRPGESVLNTQPFYHAGGTCGALPVPLTIGCRMVSPEYYEAERVLELIQRERCVARGGFAAMFLMEMKHPRFGEYDVSSLRAAWCAGPREVLEQIHESMGLEGLTQLYGSTEGGGTCGALSEPWEVRVGSHGRPCEGTEIAIADPTEGGLLPTGVTGEILTRGWWQMNGYLKQPEETAKVMRPGGWVASGDLGFIDDQGYLHYVGRLKDMVRPGGENVSAEEIEAYLMRHPDIHQVAVVGAPDDRLGEAVAAIVECRSDVELSEQDVISFCRGRIANYKVPKYVVFVREWPMTGSGKIQKNVLKETYFPDAARIPGSSEAS